jgi:putative hemolysin
MWPEVLLIVVLVAINAVLSGTEIALISLRESQLTRMRERGGTGRIVADLASEPNRYLATIQVGITLAGFLASAAAAVSLAEPLVPAFSWAGDAARTVAIVIVTVALSFLTLVFGELVPKRLALQKPEGWAMVMGRPLHWFSVAASPVVWLLSATTDAFVRLFGGTPGATREEVGLEELRDLILAAGRLPDTQREVIMGAFEVAERTIQEVMTPRPDVQTVEGDAAVSDALRAMVASGFSRLPVTIGDEGLDTAVGIVSMQDLVEVDRASPVRLHAREATVLPESVLVLTALRQLQDARQAMAFVVDEYGGIEGIVTVEDLVEEMVGEIYDEYDRDVATVRRQPDGSLIVPGRFPVHDLDEIGIDVPSGDYTTVAGLVLDQIGRVPRSGERLVLGDWDVSVLSLDGRAVTRVRFSRRSGGSHLDMGGDRGET